MKETSNYKFRLPDGTDPAAIEDINENVKTLDGLLQPTADPQVAPVNNGPGKIGQWVSWLVNRIMAITGKPNFWDNPDITLAALKSHKSRHLPGGVDPIDTAAPSGGLGADNAEGEAASYARSDHTHKAFDAVAPADVGGIPGAGVSASAARRDHVHGIGVNAVTDTHLGDRTVDDNIAPEADAGQLSALLGAFAYVLKSITGKAGWKTAPATTLEAAKAHMDAGDAHMAATVAVHGAVSTPTPDRLVTRDAAGRAQVATPSAGADISNKDYVDSQILLITSSGIPKLYMYEESHEATSIGQTEFNIDLGTFDPVTDNVIVFVNSTHLKSSEYSIGTLPNRVILDAGIEELPATVVFLILKHVATGPEGSVSGRTIAPKTIELSALTDYSVYKSIPDSNGIYTVIELKRSDGTLFLRSTLSSPNAAGNYQTRTQQEYGIDGTTLLRTITYTLNYAAGAILGDDPISEVLA